MNYDPKQCDHGTEHMGMVEWDYCWNCDPERYEQLRSAQARGVPFGGIAAEGLHNSK